MNNPHIFDAGAAYDPDLARLYVAEKKNLEPEQKENLLNYADQAEATKHKATATQKDA